MSVNPCVFYLRNISRTWTFHTTSTAFILVQVITFWMTVKVFWVVALLLLWAAIYFPVKMQVRLCHSSVNPLLEADLTESPNRSLFAYLYRPTRTPSTSPIPFPFPSVHSKHTVLLEHFRHTFTSNPLHLLFTPPGVFSLQITTWLLPWLPSNQTTLY